MDDVQFRAGSRRQTPRALGRQDHLLRAIRGQKDLGRKDYRLPAHHHYRAVGVPNNRVGDAAPETLPMRALLILPLPRLPSTIKPVSNSSASSITSSAAPPILRWLWATVPPRSRSS